MEAPQKNSSPRPLQRHFNLCISVWNQPILVTSYPSYPTIPIYQLEKEKKRHPISNRRSWLVFFWQILVDLGASAIPNGDSSPVLVFKEPIAHIAELHAWLRTQRLTKVCAWFLEHGLRLACTFCILLCRLHGRWDKLVIPFELHACTRIAFSWLQISITGLLWYILGLQ